MTPSDFDLIAVLEEAVAILKAKLAAEDQGNNFSPKPPSPWPTWDLARKHVLRTVYSWVKAEVEKGNERTRMEKG